MNNEKLYNYIKYQLSQGASKDEIKKELLGAGWKSEDIDKYFNVDNVQIPVPPIPQSNSFTSIGKQKLHPKVKWIFLFKLWPYLTITTMGCVMGGIVALSVEEVNLVVPVVLFIFAILFIYIGILWVKLSYKNYFFEIKEDEFSKESGVISKHYVSIPYDRIQNVDIYRGILERVLGLSSLKIQTAGSSIVGAEGILPGISTEYAEQLRKDLISRVRQLKN